MPQQPKKPIIIFDFDGTLVDSFTPALEYLFTTLIPQFKITEISRAQIDQLRSQTLFQLIKKIRFGWLKVPLIIWKINRWSDQYAWSFALYDHVPELIRSLKKHGYSLHILTSNKTFVVETVLRHHQLLEEFTSIHASGGLFNKDKKLLQLLRQLNLQKSDIVYVGDEIRDIQACRRADVRIISVSYGLNSSAGLRQFKPDFLVEEPRDVFSIVEKLHHESTPPSPALAD
ncbi:HAD-IA family hydrolase [Microgenomates group bacterium]|nr:HAD-IA family hydrolase [Microgenomates group bacterium]